MKTKLTKTTPTHETIAQARDAPRRRDAMEALGRYDLIARAQGVDYDLMDLVRNASSAVQLAGYIAKHTGTELGSTTIHAVGEDLYQLKDQLNAKLRSYFSRVRNSGSSYDERFVEELSEAQERVESARTRIDVEVRHRNFSDEVVGNVLVMLREAIFAIQGAVARAGSLPSVAPGSSR